MRIAPVKYSVVCNEERRDTILHTPTERMMARDVRPRKEVLKVRLFDQKGEVVETHKIRDPRLTYIENVNSDPMYAEAGANAQLPGDEAPCP